MKLSFCTVWNTFSAHICCPTRGISGRGKEKLSCKECGSRRQRNATTHVNRQLRGLLDI